MRIINVKNKLSILLVFGLWLVFSSLLSGCYILGKLDEISTLSQYSKEMEMQRKLVKHIDANYDALLSAISSGEIKTYQDQSSILKKFEEPIIIKTIEVDGQKQEQWLYRHSLGLKAKDKVYLYFDSQGKLVKYEQEKVQW